MRILIADDNRDITDSFALLLAAHGHEVEVAYDGLEACVKGAEFRPEGALLDIRMPGKHGYDVARCLCSLGSILPGCLIGMTGDGGPDAAAHARSVGIAHLLTKPTPIGVIVELFGGPV